MTALLCLCLSFSLPSARPIDDLRPAEDKWRHFVASFVVTSLAGGAARAAGLDAHDSALAGAAVGSAAGVWKEIRDARDPRSDASMGDLAWDALGIGSSAFLVSLAR